MFLVGQRAGDDRFQRFDGRFRQPFLERRLDLLPLGRAIDRPFLLGLQGDKGTDANRQKGYSEQFFRG